MFYKIKTAIGLIGSDTSESSNRHQLRRRPRFLTLLTAQDMLAKSCGRGAHKIIAHKIANYIL